ncbi:unnamed protein product [Heligmosomoides polygyrus]|uniref:Uncharacterized protein n=1 Tax=Heligmosomoides polygyrus TaxID=6339 RepID=A0A183FAM4_HELPZ|nr:unnamed protein product [Heligmosomoides polygyrus]
MSAYLRVVIHLFTLRCGPQGAFREEIKLAERIASILRDFEARQIEADEDEQLEMVEREEDWDPKDELIYVGSWISSVELITMMGDTP